MTYTTKMSGLTAIIIFLILASSAQAGDKWDNTDYTLLAVATVGTVADWQQTRYIFRNPDKYYERNPILGKHLSQESVDLYFLGAAMVKVVVAELLPSKWRKVWLGGWVAVQAGVVVHNYHIGIRW